MSKYKILSLVLIILLVSMVVSSFGWLIFTFWPSGMKTHQETNVNLFKDAFGRTKFKYFERLPDGSVITSVDDYCSYILTNKDGSLFIDANKNNVFETNPLYNDPTDIIFRYQDGSTRTICSDYSFILTEKDGSLFKDADGKTKFTYVERTPEGITITKIKEIKYVQGLAIVESTIWHTTVTTPGLNHYKDALNRIEFDNAEYLGDGLIRTSKDGINNISKIYDCLSFKELPQSFFDIISESKYKP